MPRSWPLKICTGMIWLLIAPFSTRIWQNSDAKSSPYSRHDVSLPNGRYWSRKTAMEGYSAAVSRHSTGSTWRRVEKQSTSADNMGSEQPPTLYSVLSLRSQGLCYFAVLKYSPKPNRKKEKLFYLERRFAHSIKAKKGCGNFVQFAERLTRDQ